MKENELKENNSGKFPIKSYSWTILSYNIFIKEMDKSTILYRGTGIPLDIKYFWEVENIEKNETRKITLIYNGINYDAQIKLYSTKSSTSRCRMFWSSKFSDVIRTRFPNIYLAYRNNIDIDEELPSFRFFKVLDKKDTYKVSFVNQKDIVSDAYIDDYDSTDENSSEGKAIYNLVKTYERNPKLRKLAIEYHGYTCSVCGFNFEEVYGKHGKEYIEIHHIVPLSKFTKEHIVDPKNDMSPVCSNCHKMIHRQIDNVLSIDAIKKLIKL